MATKAACRSGQAARHGRLAPIAGLALIAAGAALLSGCTSGAPSPAPSGSVAVIAQTRSVARFGRIDLAGNSNVVVTVGGRQSVVVRAERKLVSHVTTRVAGGILIVADTDSLTSNRSISVLVRVPSLAALKLSGNGQISASGINTRQLTVTISGDGLLYAAGSTSALDVTLSGNGTAQLIHLVSGNVHAVVDGAGLIEVTATTSLDAAIPGDGLIIYGGNPLQVTTSVTGTGSVTRE
jgi:Putative auto-transporter adhesin, head GIN domain